MAKEQIEFQANIAERITLKFSTPKTGDTGRGPWYLYSTADDKVFFAKPALVAAIEAACVKANETVWITRRETKVKGQKFAEVEWIVSREEANAVRPESGARRVTWEDLEGETDLTRQLKESTAMVQQQRQAAPAVVPMPARPTPSPEPTIHTLASQGMAGCIIASLDANASAEAYAAKKGIAYKASPEVIQAYACTLFIQLSRTSGGLAAMAPNDEQKQLVNGGTKWAQ